MEEGIEMSELLAVPAEPGPPILITEPGPILVTKQEGVLGSTAASAAQDREMHRL